MDLKALRNGLSNSAPVSIILYFNNSLSRFLLAVVIKQHLSIENKTTLGKILTTVACFLSKENSLAQ